MANANSENPYVGRKFQELVQSILEKEYSTSFEQEAVVAIGKPPKGHKYDLANEDRSIVAECKCYTWTETGNVPSAKMGFANEAAFYLSFLPETYEKYIVMLYSFHEKRHETLAEYYYRTNRHLLGKIKVAEFDPDKNVLRIIQA